MSNMRKSWLIAVLSTFILMSCANSDETKTISNRPKDLDSLLLAYHEERLQLFPLEATFAGDYRYNEELPNTITKAYREQLKEFYCKYKNALLNFQRSELSDDDKMNYDVLLWECDIAIEGDQFHAHLMPVNQFSCLPLIIGQLASGSSSQPFNTPKDYHDWYLRLNAYVDWCDTAIANMKIGMSQGYTIPQTLTTKSMAQFASLAQGPAESHLFYSPIKNIPVGFTDENKATITKIYKEIIEKKIIPTHQKLYAFLEKEYLPKCRTASGISEVPDGKKYYNYLIKYHTTTQLSADEIFELGQREVERISAEMLKVKDEVGFKGSLKDFFNELRAKQELMPFTKPEQVIENFYAIHQKMKPNLEKLFRQAPKTPFEIRRTEAFREASASAEYNQGSMDGKRPGIFYVPIPDVKKYNILSDEDLFLHEAIPGHHYQISLQQENTNLPKFRRLLGYSAYAEGWALYTESLGKELGLYTNPYQYFGMLSAEMHRSIRLVVDAGMHSKGWTREQAIKYSLEHEAETEESIVAEIERYMAIPGQALSYKIGQLKIRELRAKAETELGTKFNIAEFHHQILNEGSIPLKVLEDKINRWIAAEKLNSK
jgi:uncharacterized protein (DUF885 family)